MQSWTDKEVSKAIKALERSATVNEALDRLGVTGPALRAGFQRARERGLDCGSPGDHVGGARGAEKRPRASVQRQEPAAGSRDEIERIFFIPDTHVPNHDRQAWAVCLNAIRKWKPHRVFFLGDFADDECVSSHSKSPERNRLLKREIFSVNYELDKAEKIFLEAGVREVGFCGGNHCDRLDRFIADRAPELFGLVSMPDLMRVKERGWTWYPYKTSVKVGKLLVTHDFGYAGPNAASQNLAAAGHSCVTGHTHRAGIVYGGHTDGRRMVSVVSGWLGDPKEAAKYKHFDRAMREWQHGFTTAEMLKDGTAFVNFHPIIKGKTVVHGQVVTAL